MEMDKLVGVVVIMI